MIAHRSRFKDDRLETAKPMETRETRETPASEARRTSNPINRPIDGAPTRRPKVPKVLAHY